MAEQYRFFGSAIGDTREYNQVEFAEVLHTIVENGYLKDKGDELVVSESTPPAMSVDVASGEAWINGYWYQNDDVITVPIATANGSNPRRDLVILKLDVLIGRLIEVAVLTGTPASVPVLPTLTQTDQIWEIPIAEVLVGTGVITITDANITDARYASSLTGVESKIERLEATETITVGTGGQFTTINEALAFATKKYPVYVSSSVNPRVTINLLTGFQMAEQVFVDGQDLSWITISSVDAEVTIVRSALTVANTSGRFATFTAQNGGFTPIINVLFTMDTSGTATNRDGLTASGNSRAIILSGKGFKNVGSRGIYAHLGSIINAYGVIVTGASAFGIRSSGASMVTAHSSNARKGGTDSTSDFSVSSGGIISANGSTGGVSQTVNTVTADGIIFK